MSSASPPETTLLGRTMKKSPSSGPGGSLPAPAATIETVAKDPRLVYLCFVRTCPLHDLPIKYREKKPYQISEKTIPLQEFFLCASRHLADGISTKDQAFEISKQDINELCRVWIECGLIKIIKGSTLIITVKASMVYGDHEMGTAWGPKSMLTYLPVTYNRDNKLYQLNKIPYDILENLFVKMIVMLTQMKVPLAFREELDGWISPPDSPQTQQSSKEIGDAVKSEDKSITQRILLIERLTTQQIINWIHGHCSVLTKIQAMMVMNRMTAADLFSEVISGDTIELGEKGREVLCLETLPALGDLNRQRLSSGLRRSATVGPTSSRDGDKFVIKHKRSATVDAESSKISVMTKHVAELTLKTELTAKDITKAKHTSPRARSSESIFGQGDQLKNASDRLTFDSIHQNEKLKQLFTDFVKSKFSEENLLFIYEVEKYHRTPSTELAIDIHRQFISKDSPMEINVNAKTSATLAKRLQDAIGENRNPPSDLFDACYREILILIHSSLVLPFSQTPAFTIFAQESKKKFTGSIASVLQQ